jgi:hypothetical protein
LSRLRRVRVQRKVMWHLPSNLVFGLYQAVCKLPGLDVPQPDIVRKWSEQRNPAANEDRNSCDDQLLNQPFRQS